MNATGRELLPPPPPKATPMDLTLDSSDVKLDKQARSDLQALAKERDLQRSTGTATTEEWRGLLDRAQCLFRGLRLPINICRLLRQAFSLRFLKGHTTETVLARLLSKAQKLGYEAALQEYESMGLPPLPAPRSS